MSLYSPEAKMASKAKQLQVEFIQTLFQMVPIGYHLKSIIFC